jgi:lysine 2,3-aminomutase
MQTFRVDSDISLENSEEEGQPPSSGRRLFIEKFFPNISLNDWNYWEWQLKNRICSWEQLRRFLTLSEKEDNILMRNIRLPIGITPYYMSLIERDNSNQSIRKTVVPTVYELHQIQNEKQDFLGEEDQSPLPGLVHRYPDRVLLMLSNSCATYCRYCTRSRIIDADLVPIIDSRIEKAIEYIKNNSSIRDVIISGGDPLILNDNRLELIISSIRNISHVEIIRIGTKVPVVLPQRITSQLVNMLKKYHPLWMSIHFTHPDECTPEVYESTRLLADAGIPLGSQTVLLKNVNDDLVTIRSLMHHLLMMRVRPYYLYQCDQVVGTNHFQTSVSTGLEIIKGLRGFTSGYAVPHYVIDLPNGGGKIPLLPSYIKEEKEDTLVIYNYKNQIFKYKV